MSENLLNGIAKDAILVVLKIAGPFLLAAMVIGLIISIFQATCRSMLVRFVFGNMDSAYNSRIYARYF